MNRLDACLATSYHNVEIDELSRIETKWQTVERS